MEAIKLFALGCSAYHYGQEMGKEKQNYRHICIKIYVFYFRIGLLNENTHDSLQL